MPRPKVDALSTAQQAFVDLFMQIDIDDYLSAEEIRQLLVQQLGVTPKVESKDVANAFCKPSKDGTIDATYYGRTRIKFYAKSVNKENCCLYPARNKETWTLPIVDFANVDHQGIDELVDTINTYFEPPVPLQQKLEIVCEGFKGPLVDVLFTQSLLCSLSDWRMSMTQQFPDKIYLPECILKNAGASDIHFAQQKDFSWKLVSNKCCEKFEKDRTARYCPGCSAVRYNVHNICSNVSTDTTGRDILTERMSLALAGNPERVKDLFQTKQRKHDKKCEKLNKVHAEQLQRALDRINDKVPIESLDDADKARRAFELLEPLILEHFGHSESSIIWEQMIKGMSRPLGSSPRYHTIPLQFGIKLASQMSQAIYDEIKDLLFLPSYGHCKNEQRKMVNKDEGGNKTGYHTSSVEAIAELARGRGWMDDGPIPVVLSFDTMVMKKGLMLSTRKADKGRFLGCVVTEDLATLEFGHLSSLSSSRQDAPPVMN